jgi:hypothetical protein
MPPIQLSLRDLSQLVIRQTQGGRTRDEIVKVLVERGWPETSAVRFVNLTLTEHKETDVPEQKSEYDQSFGRQTSSTDRVRWQMILVVVLVTASLILCNLIMSIR